MKLPINLCPTDSCAETKTIIATTAGQHVEKSHLDLQITNSLIPRCVENTTCLTYDNCKVQQAVVRFATTYDLLRVTTF